MSDATPLGLQEFMPHDVTCPECDDGTVSVRRTLSGKRGHAICTCGWSHRWEPEPSPGPSGLDNLDQIYATEDADDAVSFAETCCGKCDGPCYVDQVLDA